jgi:uncharacterized protein (DUF433 family)
MSKIYIEMPELDLDGPSIGLMVAGEPVPPHGVLLARSTATASAGQPPSPGESLPRQENMPPLVRDTGIPVALVLHNLVNGLTPAQIVARYPELVEDDIRQCLKLAAWLLREPSIDWQSLNLTAMVELYDEMRDWESASDEVWGK